MTNDFTPESAVAAMEIVLLTKCAGAENKLELNDEATLTATERRHTTLQAERISAGLIPIDRTFDAAHIKAIHAALFSRIYTWHLG